MNLYTINTGNFKLDGGAMFGVVPKVIWNKSYPADEKNLCNWTMRCLLVEDGDRLILIDNGIGDKQDAKFFGHYYLNGDDTLDKSLKKAGFHVDDITDVFLTHLHFDHCGGSVKWKKDRSGYEPVFKNATYWSHEQHWKHALDSNPREKNSFLMENFMPVLESGQLKFMEQGQQLTEHFHMRTVNGHTDAMMLPQIRYKDRTIVFMADLIPSTAHIPVPYVMSYDVRPLDSMKEKAGFLQEAHAQNYILFFEHDLYNECCMIEHTERGFRAGNSFLLSDL